MAISNNPTKTLTIEKAWNREINKRWRDFTKVVVSELRQMNKSNLIGNAEKIPFTINTSQQRIYMTFLRQQIDAILLGTPEPPNWQARYQVMAYQRGLERTINALRTQGVTPLPTFAEFQAAQALEPFTAISTLGTGPAIPGAPIHQPALEFLFTRSYDSLEGWTNALARETQQILFNGVSQGKGINEVVRNMVDRIGVSRSRARVIARTETIQAYQQSTVIETERIAEEIGEEILLRWITAKDGRVRHLHATWHGTIATPQQNQQRIQESPWNCRCAQIPVIKETNTPEKNRKFAEERKKLLSIERR